MKSIILFVAIIVPSVLLAQIPEHAKKLMKYYPQIVRYDQNRIYFNDGSSMIYDDHKKKSSQELLDNPDIQDQFTYEYKRGKQIHSIPKSFDPGRIRNEEMFKKIYGASESEVRKNVKDIVWCPTLAPQTILITTVNNVHEHVQRLSNELDKHPEWKEYISNIAGTFNWRTIAGTNRLSFHSFGMTIDINIRHSHYWQWDCKCKNESSNLQYRNAIPQELVDIFEKHGFIWGGKWYHYDTMHFEYRPELIF